MLDGEWLQKRGIGWGHAGGKRWGQKEIVCRTLDVVGRDSEGRCVGGVVGWTVVGLLTGVVEVAGSFFEVAVRVIAL